MLAKVKWFNKDKGYGFLKMKNNEDIFVHYSKILIEGYKFLSKDQVVNFDLCCGKNGFYAKNVFVVKDVKH